MLAGAGITAAGTVVAASGDDETNLLIASLSRTHFDVKTISATEATANDIAAVFNRQNENEDETDAEHDPRLDLSPSVRSDRERAPMPIRALAATS